MSETVATKRQSRAESEGRTNYSTLLRGVDGNYRWSVMADVHARGYIGITQYDERGAVKDRVLLSKAQWSELIRFVREETPR